VALQLLGNLFEYFLAKRKGQADGHLTILGATSGDTGACRAVRHGDGSFVLFVASLFKHLEARESGCRDLLIGDGVEGHDSIDLLTAACLTD